MAPALVPARTRELVALIVQGQDRTDEADALHPATLEDQVGLLARRDAHAPRVGSKTSVSVLDVTIVTSAPPPPAPGDCTGVDSMLATARSRGVDRPGRGARQASNQPITNCRPTAVSSVALAACSDTDHVWSPTIPSTAYATPRLECFDRRLGMRAEVAVDALRGDAPRPGSTIGQHGLKAFDHGPGRTFLQGRHRSAVGQRRPGEGTDDAVDDQARTLLELAHRLVGRGTEVAVHDESEVRRSTQRALHSAYDVTLRAESRPSVVRDSPWDSFTLRVRSRCDQVHRAAHGAGRARARRQRQHARTVAKHRRGARGLGCSRHGCVPPAGPRRTRRSVGLDSHSALPPQLEARFGTRIRSVLTYRDRLNAESQEEPGAELGSPA